MRAPWWLRRRSRDAGTVTVELVADTSRFDQAIGRLVANTREHDSRTRFRRRVAHERSLGQAYVGVALDGLCRDFGLDPVAAWRLPRQRDELLQRLTSPDRATRQAAEAEWLRVHREHRAVVVERQERADGH